MPKPLTRQEQIMVNTAAANALARLETYFSPENMEQRNAAIVKEYITGPGRRFNSLLAISGENDALKESLADSKRDVERLEARNEQLKAELDRAFDVARESRQIPAPVQVQVELKLPDSLPELNVALAPSNGVEIIRDDLGNITGTRPRPRGSGVDPVTKAIKKTQAGQSVVP